MNLDKRIDMLTDEQAVELDPIINLLHKELSLNYKASQFELNSSAVKEAILIKAYKSPFAKDKNYQSVVDACAEKILENNTVHMLLYYSEDNSFMAGLYLQRNLKFQRLVDSKN
jgi:hypothetical protein